MAHKLYIYLSVILFTFMAALYVLPEPVLTRHLYGALGPSPGYEEVAAKHGNNDAQFNLGARTIKDDKSQGENWLREAASAGNQKAINNLGVALAGAGANIKAVKLFKGLDIPEAKNNLAIHIFQGLGMDEADPAAAKELLMEARDLPSFIPNMLAMGFISLNDQNVAQANPKMKFNTGVAMEKAGNIEGAKEWYAEAYKNGYTPAGFNLYILEPDTDKLIQLHAQGETKATRIIGEAIQARAKFARANAQAMGWANQAGIIKEKLREVGILQLQSPDPKKLQELIAQAGALKTEFVGLAGKLKDHQSKLEALDREEFKKSTQMLIDIARKTSDRKLSDTLVRLLKWEQYSPSMPPNMTELRDIEEYAEALVQNTSTGPYPEARATEYSLAKPEPYQNSKWWIALDIHRWITTSSIMLTLIFLATGYLVLFYRRDIKIGVGKAKTANKIKPTAKSSPKRMVVKEQEADSEKLKFEESKELLGLSGSFSWRDMHSAFLAKAEDCDEKARKRMTPTLAEAAEKKYARLLAAKKTLEEQEIR